MSTRMTPLLMPRVNANDDGARIVRWLRHAGDAVKTGDLLLQIETTKAAIDIESPVDGFLHPLANEGSFGLVGATLAWIGECYDPQIISDAPLSPSVAPDAAERLISARAQTMMESAGLTATDIPGSGPIDLRQVQCVLGRHRGIAVATSIDALAISRHSVILYGAAEQGVAALDAILEKHDHLVPLCFVDDDPRVAVLSDLPVFSSTDLDRIIRRGARRAHICIGAPGPKQRVAERLTAAGVELVNAIHLRAVIARSARLGRNVYVGPGAIIGPKAEVGDFCQINNNATVPHHVRLGWGVRVSDGANIAGGVTVGDRAYIGLGVTINTGCNIGADATLVSGVSIFDAVPEGATVRTGITKR